MYDMREEKGECVGRGCPPSHNEKKCILISFNDNWFRSWRLRKEGRNIFFKFYDFKRWTLQFTELNKPYIQFTTLKICQLRFTALSKSCLQFTVKIILQFTILKICQLPFTEITYSCLPFHEKEQTPFHAGMSVEHSTTYSQAKRRSRNRKSGFLFACYM